MTSTMTAAAIIGPLAANGSFAIFISPQSPLTLPGAPFFLGSILCLAALVLAWRGSPHAAAPAPATSAEVASQAQAVAA
jgi:DHA1 family tetracycline resistance protein-like MFS transporter